LIDTSIWVGHFKHCNEHLVALLENDNVVCHPHVVMEVACGTPPNRRSIVSMLAELESAPLATSDELLELIERRSLYGRGCGLVDISLLASTLLSEKTLLWTADKRLETLATELNRSYRPTLHS
jgi:predicted nucleic acid-binding protein